MRATAACVPGPSCKAILLLILGTVGRVASHPSGESSLGEDGGNPPWKEDADSSDLTIDESHPALSFLAAPPRYETSHHHRGREWRYVHEAPSYSSNWNSPPGYDTRQSFPQSNSNINFDYRLDPFTNKRDDIYSTLPSRPTQGFFNPYVRVDGGDHQSHLKQGNRDEHHSQISRYQPGSKSSSFPHESSGHEQRQEKLQEEFYINEQPPRHVVHQGELIYHEQHDEAEQDGRYEREHSHPERQNSEHVSEHIHEGALRLEEPIYKENDREESLGPTTDDSEVHREKTSIKRSEFLQPGNLAALLAGARSIGLKSPESTEGSTHTADYPERKEEGSSKTRTAVPEHIMRSELHSSSDYYDDLYDEFVDLYYDAENKQEGKVKGFREFVEEKMKRNISADGKHNQNTMKGLKLITTEMNHSMLPTQESTEPSISSPTLPAAPETTTTLKTTKASTTTTTTTATSSTTPTASTTRLKTILSSASPSTTIKQEKSKEATTPATTVVSNSPISLSEVLEELGLSLSQFLGTLRVHGSSLKEFTVKLQGKSLSKTEFRRAKGNVKKLLEILESSPDRSSRFSVTRPEQITVSVTTSTERTSSSPISSVSTTAKKPETTIPVTEKTQEITKLIDKKPRIFGSRPSGISLTKLDSEKPESENRNNQSSSRTKPPIVVELDIAKLVKEKGVSAAGILQGFKNMFNISETSSDVQNKTIFTTPEPPDKEEMTDVLRPYKKGAERYRPYRPVDYERGNSKIHRGIINHRLNSTPRPTLRPPYIPSPPSINFGESVENFDVNTFILKKDTTGEGSSTDNSNSKITDNTSRRGNKQNSELLYNYNVIKSSPESLDVSTRSAIMAAGILGGVALSVFIAIFIVVKYRNHMHRHRRRIPLTLPSDSSSSSLPPIYASRPAATYGKECYQTSGFWTSLKKRFDPYSPSSSPTSM